MAATTSRPTTPTTTLGATVGQAYTAPRDSAQATTTVQRQLTVPSLEDAATAINMIAPAVAASGSTTAPPVQPKLDTDELARQVYVEIKRKLAVERERLRLG